MANIVDRTGPRLDLLPDSAENTALGFPFSVTPKNGWKTVGTVPTTKEIYFKVDKDINFAIGSVRDHNQLIFGWSVAGDVIVLITPSGLYSISNINGQILDDSFHSITYSAGKLYMMRLRFLSDSAVAAVYDASTGERLLINSSVTVTGIGGTPRDLMLGFPTDNILASDPYDSEASTKPALDFTIVDVKEDNTGPDDWAEVSPKLISHLPRLAGSTIAKVVGRHPRQYELTYAKSPSQASPDGTYFDIVGDSVITTSAFTTMDPSTVYALNVRVRDKFTWSEDYYVYMYSGPAVNFQEMTVDNLAVTAPATAVGSVVVTSGMAGTIDEPYTLSFGNGQGSADNHLFALDGDVLSFIDPSVAGTYYIQLRVTSNLTGLYIEGNFEVVVSAE